MDAHKQLYREEAFELLAELEQALIELEQQPGDLDIVNRIFRAMHTIKGSGAMFGFDEIASFTHTIETVYDLIREGKLRVDEELISLTLRSCDQIKAMLDASVGGEGVDADLIEEITASFKGLISSGQDAAPGQSEFFPACTGGDREDGLKAEIAYRIRFKPHRELFQNGTNPIPLLNEIRELGHAHVICHLKELPGLEELDPEACYASWDIILITDRDADAIRDVFIFVEHVSDIEIARIDDCSEADHEEYKKIGEILFERGDISLSDLESILGRQKKIGELLVESGKACRSEVQSALMEQEQVRHLRKKHMSEASGDSASSIRVASHKLDSLVNLVGELVTVQARLTQLAAQRDDHDLVLVSEEVERLAAELRDNAMGIRMLPIGTTFARFKRLVRDLSTELGKEVNFTTSGEETELDKTVIDRLGDPLVHLIRNSIDHGIESPEERRAAGKPVEGTIRLRAEHSGAHVLISVSDDGAGLDTEAIRAKAIEKGLISPDAGLSEKEIFELIFAPGFSTARSVSKVSGRGVGMDVVVSSIESLGGTVEIESEKGKGTTITLKLPLTLAIIDGLLVTISGEYFVIPLNAVVECVELSAEDRRRSHGRNLARVRDEIVPYIPLRKVFSLDGDRPAIEQVVVTENSGRRIGFVVDKVVGQHQTVIKNLGRFLRHVEGVSGATIMGDGTVALILDINKLIQQREFEETTASSSLCHA
ncbi:MAG: chemotaxis protein CheA [Desulfomonilia bacterium]|jgi:two-component system chemotaxis sensor kinase CheA